MFFYQGENIPHRKYQLLMARAVCGT